MLYFYINDFSDIKFKYQLSETFLVIKIKSKINSFWLKLKNRLKCIFDIFQDV